MSALTTSLQFGLGGAWLAEHTLRSIGAGLAIFDEAGCLTQIDERAAELLGLEVDGALGQTLDDERWSGIHLDGSPVSPATDPVRNALVAESASVADVVGVISDAGETRWLAVTALPLPGLDGSTQAALVSLVEVTGIIRDRAAVDVAEQVGRAAFDNSRTPMCLIDLVGRLVDWNRSFASRLDRADYELMATPLDRWIEGGGTIAAVTRSKAHGELSMDAHWTDGTPVSIRSWKSDDLSGGRTMVELAPGDDWPDVVDADRPDDG